MARFDAAITLTDEADGSLVLSLLVDQGFTVGPVGKGLYTKGPGPGVLMMLRLEYPCSSDNRVAVIRQAAAKIANEVSVLSAALYSLQDQEWAVAAGSLGQGASTRPAREAAKERVKQAQKGPTTAYDQLDRD